MSPTYKQKLIRRIAKLLMQSRSPMLNVLVEFGVSNHKTGEVVSIGPMTLRELILFVIDTEL